MFVCIVVDSVLVRTPLNSAAVRGSTVTLECISRISTTAAIHWLDVTSCADYSATCNSLRQIYTGFNLATDAPSGFSVTEVDNATHVTRNLNIDSTQLFDAGVYHCAEQIAGVAGFTESSNARLIILGNRTNIPIH